MIFQDLKLWQQAAVVIGLPFLVEIALFSAVQNAQEQVNTAYKAERVANEEFVFSAQGMKVCLDGIGEAFNYRTIGHAAQLARCHKFLDLIKALREKYVSRAPDFAGTPLDRFMLEVQALLGEMVVLPLKSSDVYDVKELPHITKMASRAIAAFDAQSELLKTVHDQKVKEVEEKQKQLSQLIVCGIAGSTLLALAMAAFFQRATASQIKTLMDNTSRLARREDLLPALRGRSELAALDRTFHTMAANISTLNERERAVFANSKELILIVDSDAKIQLASRSSAEILARAADEIVGLRVSELSPEMVNELEKTKTLGNNKFEIEVSGAGGKRVQLEVSSSYSPADKNFYCVAHDISARKALERSKQDFYAMVSHDLRSPISSSQAALQMLMSDSELCKLSSEGRRMLERMSAGNTRLLGLITDLLDMEKLEYGLITLDYELVTFDDLTLECMTALEGLARAKDVRIVCDESPSFIYCDFARIVQVLINIASNAIKVSSAGSKVELRFRESGDFSRISVIDTGPGIAEDFLPHIFERYAQGPDKAVMHQGSGLGLAVARELVELHKGSIAVSSEMGKGSTFTVILPQRKEREP